MNQLNNARWMRERGHDVVILCKEGSPMKDYAAQSALKIRLIPEHRRYKYLAAGFQLKKILLEEQISHLIVRSSNDLNICSIAKRFSRNKFQLLYFMEMQLGVSKKNFLHTARFKQIDSWICSTEYLKQLVLSHTRFRAEKIRILTPGLDLAKIQSRLSREEARKELELPQGVFLLGLIGRIDPLKGQKMLIEALALLDDQSTCLCLMGAPTLLEPQDYYEEIKAYISEKKLENRVFLKAFRDDVSAFYRAIDVCVMASKSETFGMVSIEALANGTPVIGSNSGGTPEILKFGELGLLFESQNAKDLCAKIVSFQENPNSISKEDLIEASLPYSHEKICAEIEKLLF